MLKHGGVKSPDIIDFSVNINGVLTSEMMKAILVDKMDMVLEYPEIDGASLIDTIASSYDIKKEHLYVGNGASDCLYQMAQTLRPETVLLIEPTFTEYRRAFEISGATVLPLIYNLNVSAKQAQDQLLTQIKKIKSDMVVICNPNNPTGHSYSEAFIRNLTKIQEAHKGYVMVDESFRFFEERQSAYKKDAWNLIILTSLTKYFALPGLRVGYLSTNVSLVNEMKNRQIPWNLNALAIEAAKAFLGDAKIIAKTNQWYNEEKAYMVKALNQIPYLDVFDSKANYIFFVR